MILREAAAKLMDRNPETVAAMPEIECRAMRNMRNRIAHGYYDINLDTVWETVSSALPELVERFGGLTKNPIVALFGWRGKV